MEKFEKIFINPDTLSEKGESEILYKLEKIDRNATVLVYINSPGGDLYSAFSIIDAIRFFSKKSIGIVMSRAYSAAVDVLLSLDRRFCTPLSTVMIHETSLSFDGFEFTSRLGEEIAMQKKIEEERIKVILKKTAIDKETLKYYLEKKQDLYFNSNESVEWGICESILKNERDLFKALKPV